MAAVKEVCNTWEQLVNAGGGVAITKAYNVGRGEYRTGWNVLRINSEGQERITDPEAAWYHHGQKHFSSFDCSLAEALDKAKRWVNENIVPVETWARNRHGDYVPAEVNKQFPIRKESQ